MKRDLPAALSLFMSLLMVLVALLGSLLLAHWAWFPLRLRETVLHRTVPLDEQPSTHVAATDSAKAFLT